MTSNQIKYQELEEARYHNRIMEQETKRSNQAEEAIKQQTNLINQQHYMYSDAETARANQAREMENTLHNRTTEAIEWFKASNDAQLKQSNIRLNESNVMLNSAIKDDYLADIAKKEAETEYTKEQTQTEGYKRMNLWASIQDTYANTAFTKQKTETEEHRTKTEQYNTAIAAGTAGLTELDVLTYNNNRFLQALSGGQNALNNSVGSAARLYTALKGKTTFVW